MPVETTWILVIQMQFLDRFLTRFKCYQKCKRGLLQRTTADADNASPVQEAGLSGSGHQWPPRQSGQPISLQIACLGLQYLHLP